MKIILITFLLIQLGFAKDFFKENLITLTKMDKKSNSMTVEAKNYDENIGKPLILIIGAKLCASCTQQQEEIRDFLNSDYGFLLDKVEILTLQIAYKNHINGLKELSDWKVQHRIPWRVAAVSGQQQISEIFEEYCKPSDPDYHALAPCVAVFKPGIGKVLETYKPTMQDILRALQ